MVVVIRDLQPLHILDQFRAVVAVTSASGHSRSCNNRQEIVIRKSLIPGSLFKSANDSTAGPMGTRVGSQHVG